LWHLLQWHPHPTTGQVFQSSPTPDLISEEDESVFPITPGLFAAIFCNKFKYIGNIDFLLFNFMITFQILENYSIFFVVLMKLSYTKTKENNNISGNLPLLLLCIVFNELSYFL
jgi:hypothetical protein